MTQGTSITPMRGRCKNCGHRTRQRKVLSSDYCSTVCETGARPRCGFSPCSEFARYDGHCPGHDQQRRKGLPLSVLVSRRTAEQVCVRDARGRKLCPSCESWLTEGEFSPRVGAPDELAPYCRSCSNFRSTLARYGITPEEHAELLRRQRGGCAVCGETPADRQLAVDHDHKCCPGRRSCGRCVRGLLCGPCNVAIGMLREDPRLFRNATAYLSR